MGVGVGGPTAIAVAAGGSTFATQGDFQNVTANTSRAGVLKLDLGSAGVGAVPLNYRKLAPSSSAGRTIWAASDEVAAGRVPYPAVTETSASPTDDAAQGDGLTFDVSFDLVQVTS